MGTGAKMSHTPFPHRFQNAGRDKWQDEMLSSRRLKTALNDFALATEMSISVWDDHLKARMGPFTGSPLTKLLAAADCWNQDDGFCYRCELEVAKSAFQEGTIIQKTEGGMFHLFGVPLYLQSQLLGAVVGGWIFSKSADSSLTENTAKEMGLAVNDLAPILSKPQVIGRKQLLMHAGLVNSWCNSFIKERAENLLEQEYSRKLLALNESAKLFAIADSEDEVGATTVNALKLLNGVVGVSLLVSDNANWRTVAVANKKPNEIQPSKTLRIPLEGTHGALLGAIQLDIDDTFDEANHQSHLSAIASQTAVALQKVTLIGDLERERASLERTNQIKDEFLTVLTHELRTPLTPIMGWVSMLRHGTQKHSEETVQKALAAIERNACQELHLVNELLDLARILNNKIVLELEVLNPDDVVASVFATADSLIDTRRLKLELTTSPNLPTISADSHRLHQVLTNLLSNAVKFTEDGGTISLGARLGQENSVEFFICDTGVGISADDLPHVFDSFWQADSSLSRRYGGLGIGLSLVKGFVELHGGTLSVDSGGENRGSCFVVSLPTSASR